MFVHTGLLRVLIVLLGLGLALAAGLLHVMSLDMAVAFPEAAHLPIPIFVAVVVGLLPGLVALHALWMILDLVDHGAACSSATVGLLGRIRRCFTVTAVYVPLTLIVVWVAMLPLQHPSVLLVGLGGEVVALFLMALAALLERLIDRQRSGAGNAPT